MAYMTVSFTVGYTVRRLHSVLFARVLWLQIRTRTSYHFDLFFELPYTRT